MDLEYFLDHMLDKGTHDIVIVNEAGEEFSTSIHGSEYIKCEVIEVHYEKIARIKIKKGN